MAEEIIPPDLIGAGVAQQPQPPASLPRATLPGGLMQQLRGAPEPMSNGFGLLQMLAQPQQAPNMGLAAGAGILDSLAGRAGNSYLAQHNQQVDTDYRRRSEMIGLADRMQTRQRAEAEKKDAALMTIIQGLKDSDNPGAQAVYGNEMARRASGLGLKITPEFFTQSAKVSQPEQDEIRTEIYGGLSPDQITARHPRLARMSPDWLSQFTQVAKSPPAMDKFGWKTPEQLQDIAKKNKVAQDVDELKGWRARVPEVTDAQEPHVAAFIRSKTGGPLQGVDSSTPEGQRFVAEGIAFANRQLATEKEQESQRKVREATALGVARREGREGRMRFAPAGGAFYDRQTKEMLAAVPESDVAADPGRFRSVSGKSLDALTALESTDAIVAPLKAMADRLFTAKTPLEAAAQGSTLTLGALTKSNALAATYRDDVEAFLGTISRTLGGERGALATKDIERIRGAFPGFGSTAQIKDGNFALITNLIAVAREAQAARITGEPMPKGSEERIAALLNQLDPGGAKLGPLGVAPTTGWGKAQRVN